MINNILKTGAFIKKRRTELRLSQNDLAKKLNVSNVLISYWENGIRPIKEEYYDKISVALNITRIELLNGEHISKKNIKSKLKIEKKENKIKHQITFGEYLSFKRKQQKLSQLDFSNIIHVSIPTVSRWERNKNFPDYYSLVKIADFYQIQVSELNKLMYDNNTLISNEEITKQSSSFHLTKYINLLLIFLLISIVVFTVKMI